MALTAALPAQAIRFQEQTAAAGITWVQIDPGIIMGGGGAFLDYDGDGWQDILLVGGRTQPELYRNVGGTQFVLQPQAAFPLPVHPVLDMCVSVADFDNDGDPDVFLGSWGPNHLYRNDGGGIFTDITPPGIAGIVEWTTSGAWGDYDGDGNLDLYIGNYVMPPFMFPNHTPTPNKLFRGHGNGTFTDVTTPVVAAAGTTLATAWSDYDGDGDIDLFVGNDFGEFVEPNRLLRNDGPGPGGTWDFTDVSVAMGADAGIYCMGIAAGDIDRDLDLDYYFTNIGTNVMLRNDRGGFTDVTFATGTDATQDPVAPKLFATSWGIGFFDFDQDSWLDLYVSNGHIPAAASIANGTTTPNMLFRNDGGGTTFTEVATSAAADDRGKGRGVAFGDYDNDGDIDVLQVNVQAAPVLLQNITVNPGNWARVELEGVMSNRDALGARLEATLSDHVQLREVARNFSYESSSEQATHFGLGANTIIRELAVRWPSGIEQQVYDLPANVEYALLEPRVTVDVDIQMMGPPSAPMLHATAMFTNHTGQPITIFEQVELRFAHNPPVPAGPPGTPLWIGPSGNRTIPASGVDTAVFTMAMPLSLVAPTPIVDLVWRAIEGTTQYDDAKVGVRRR